MKRVVQSGFNGIAEKPRRDLEAVVVYCRADRAFDVIHRVRAGRFAGYERPLFERQVKQRIEPPIESPRRACGQTGDYPEVTLGVLRCWPSFESSGHRLCSAFASKWTVLPDA
jgi:hypothetical protein